MLVTAARDLLLKNNDLVVTTDFQFSRGIPGVIQSILIVLQMFQGEWFLNFLAGIPYFQRILGQKPAVAIAAVRLEMRDALLAVEDVTEIIKLQTDFNDATRTLTVRWQVRTTFGDSSLITTNLTVGA